MAKTADQLTDTAASDRGDAYWRQPDVLRLLIAEEVAARGGDLEEALAACQQGRPTTERHEQRNTLAQILVALTGSLGGSAPETDYLLEMKRDWLLFDVVSDDVANALGLSVRTVQRLIERGRALFDDTKRLKRAEEYLAAEPWELEEEEAQAEDVLEERGAYGRAVCPSGTAGTPAEPWADL